MLPTLADAADLAQWANRLDAQGLLPKLIHRLILATSKAELSTTERGSTPSTFTLVDHSLAPVWMFVLKLCFVSCLWQLVQG